MTKYVVSGYIGFDNFGDEAIAHSLVETLKKQGATDITLISSNPEKTKKIHEVNACGMFQFFDAIKRSDVLISGGGSLLQDVTSIKSLLYYLGVIYSALILGKKVEIFAQGIGPINSKFGQFFTKFALKNANKISVRDEKSQQLLSAWGIESELVKDPVLNIDIPVRNEKGIVGIQLRKFSTLTDSFLESLAKEICIKFPDKHIQIFSLQDNIDLEVCENFADLLKKQGFNNEIKVLKNLSIIDVLDKISHLEYMIAMRFHANVVAIKACVKTIAINYDIKVKKLAEEYNLPILEMNQTDFSQVFEDI